MAWTYVGGAGYLASSTLISRVEILPSRLCHPRSNQWWDNLVAALKSEHYNCICEIDINDMTNSCWERFAAMMQKPFLELTNLGIWVRCDVALAFPDSFLGGSVPHLQGLRPQVWRDSESISINSESNFITRSLGHSWFWIHFAPHYGHCPDSDDHTRIPSPSILFSPWSCPNPAIWSLLPPTCSVLPTLTKLTFEGIHEYLEDLLTQIDAPLLYKLFKASEPLIYFLE